MSRQNASTAAFGFKAAGFDLSTCHCALVPASSLSGVAPGFPPVCGGPDASQPRLGRAVNSQPRLGACRVPQASILRLGNCGWQRRSYRASPKRPTSFSGPFPRLPAVGGPAPTSRGHLPHIPAGHVTIPPLFHSPLRGNHFGVLFLCGNLTHDTPSNSPCLRFPSSPISLSAFV